MLTRVDDLMDQHRGIDLKIHTTNGEVFNIDEKAQLNYIGEDLPTFAFEVAYFNKHHVDRIGWLYDDQKLTDFYFLVTKIRVRSGVDIQSGISGVKVTMVSREKLKQFLASKGITKEFALSKARELRIKGVPGPDYVDELKKSEGCFYLSTQLEERPINIVLNLNFLISNGVARVLINED